MKKTWDDGSEERHAPEHQLPNGGQMPDLNLAGANGFNVASGYSLQSMPDPGKPAPYIPTLHGSPTMGGIDPETPIPALNLAGVDGVPTPAELVQGPGMDGIHQPDFAAPNLLVPGLQPFDLCTGIHYAYGSEFAADPALPDLTEYRHPYGLDIQPQKLQAADPPLDDLLHYDLPSGLTVVQHVQEPDPLLPDLQNPALAPDVQTSTRPGDLDPSALRQMRLGPEFEQATNVPYAQIFLDQSGMNTTRRRHMDLLMSGLEADPHPARGAAEA